MMNSVGLISAPETVSRPKFGWFTSQHNWAIGLSLLLIAVTIVLYLPVLHHPFANLDDQGYVYENLQVQSGLTWSTIKWAFTTLDDSNWHPLTWLSHTVDCQLFGIDPAGHHEMNVIWHVIDAVLLFWVLLQATGYLGRSFMVAALFALHPINVEAVAWVAERKTMLSTFFFLLALAAYRWYASRPKVGRYAVVAFLFACGLMAKPQIITLPCVLLLWDYWPLRRMFPGLREAPDDEPLPPLLSRSLQWLLLEKVPLLFLCAASSLVTMKAQHVGRPKYWAYTFPVRIENALVAYARYVQKAFWPSKLAVLYPHPGNFLPAWQVLVASVCLLAVTALVIVGYRYRYLPVGWFWFLGTMVPTIGIIQVGRQALADRYAYQSFLGLFIMVCWGLADWTKRKRLPAALLPGISVAVLLALTVVTYRQIGYWDDNLAMWTRAIQVTRNNWVAEDMAAGLLTSQGHSAEAMAHYRAAAAIAPNDPISNLVIAIYEQQHGNAQRALQLYKVVLTQMDDPLEQAKVYQNMAVAYRDLGDHEKFVECARMMTKLRQAAAAHKQ
jgi:tetratricopeptide (TPR) repeat protein